MNYRGTVTYHSAIDSSCGAQTAAGLQASEDDPVPFHICAVQYIEQR